MQNTNTPQADAPTATNYKFGAGFTTNAIKRAVAKIGDLKDEAFDRSLALGADLPKVKVAWNDGLKEQFKSDDSLPNGWDKAVPHLTDGMSRSWMNKLISAAKSAEATPDVVEAYKSAERAKKQDLSVERFIDYCKACADSADGEEVEAGDTRSSTSAKYVGQFQVTGACPQAVRITEGRLIETEAEEEDIIVGLAILREALLASGMKKAAAAIRPIKDEELQAHVVSWMTADPA